MATNTKTENSETGAACDYFTPYYRSVVLECRNCGYLRKEHKAK